MARRADDTDGRKAEGGAVRAPAVEWNAAFRAYINYTPTELEKSNFEAWCETESLWETLASAVSDGVNLSLKAVPKDGCYLASGTQRRPTSPNAGLVVTARAATAWKAFARVLFTLAILYHSERWEDIQPVAEPDRW
jgi:PAS domain-containing protein